MTNVVIRDSGFVTDDWDGQLFDWEQVQSSDWQAIAGYGLDLPNTVNADELTPFMEAAMIRIDFPSFADGRGFTIARHLRLLGYQGRLRAYGHVISDQYAMARRCGFDEVEISAELAARQPEQEWQFRADWQANNYQDRLRKAG